MYLWNLALRKGCLGHIKYLLKKSLMKLPVFGWGFYVLEFIPLERDWVVDEPVIRQTLSTFTNPHNPLWLTVFPEQITVSRSAKEAKSLPARMDCLF
ncbi:hypothetical protein K7X08_001852 [Anisodus acutangulus]|uniref:Phospholipid/glycerol acyltransferase domain-containing protein n=1 Tax=Anisodus acutangulus TaxID=402998 RepID=A0A9Q1LQR3_9SOLA|nr:hypothetical protein K7X08_001852 [Anisodus acutangulus]